jgi:hypothetical protein
MSEVTTNLLQIKACIIGLKFEAKTGMKTSRPSAKDCAKRILGYTAKQRPTYDKLIEQMTKLEAEASKIVKVGQSITINLNKL